MPNTITEHRIVVGDTLQPISATLTRNNTAVNLTGLTAKFRMVAKDGTVVIDNATATIVSAANGQVSYTFTSGQVATAGEYWGWFLIFSGDAYEHFPHDGRKLRIYIESE